MITKQVVFIFCYLVLCEVHCTNREISFKRLILDFSLAILYFQSVTELPESMAAPLTLLVMLPVIMTATGVLSILASATILLCIFLCSRTRGQKLGAEEEARPGHVKLVRETGDIVYSKVPGEDSQSHSSDPRWKGSRSSRSSSELGFERRLPLSLSLPSLSSLHKM